MILYRPVPSSCVVTLRFGPYPPDIAKLTGRQFHFGIDFARDSKSPVTKIPVTAAADGTILRTGYCTMAGRFIQISHVGSQGLLITSYLHLATLDTIKNKLVLAGDTIGTMGSSGIVTDQHLHFGFGRLSLDRYEALDPGLFLVNTKP